MEILIFLMICERNRNILNYVIHLCDTAHNLVIDIHGITCSFSVCILRHFKIINISPYMCTCMYA